MPLTSRPRRVGRAGALTAVAATALLFATACDPVAKPADGLYTSWKYNDADGAHAFATDAAVDSMFERVYTNGDQWMYIHCEGAAGSTYCSWVNKVETEMVLRITNSTQKVTTVTRTSIDSGVAGRFFHAWRHGSTSEATPYGTSAARSQLFAHTYSANAHWLPDGCDGAAGSLYCTWLSTDGHKIVLRYDNLDTHLVTSATYA